MAERHWGAAREPPLRPAPEGRPYGLGEATALTGAPKRQQNQPIGMSFHVSAICLSTTALLKHLILHRYRANQAEYSDWHADCLIMERKLSLTRSVSD
jgi:hypothetical protein